MIKHKKTESSMAIEMPDYGKALFFTDLPMEGEDLIPIPRAAGNNYSLTPNVEVKIVKKEAQVEHDVSHYLDNIDLSIKEYMYVHSMNYYQNMFGFPLLTVSDAIIESPEYKKVKVESGLQLFALFNLAPSEEWLFKFALLQEALPLPPEIIEREHDGRKEYTFLGFNLRNIPRPPYFYVMEIISYLKKKVSVFPEWRYNKETIFYDDIGRICQNLNLEQIYREWISQSTKTKTINFTETKHKRGEAKEEDSTKGNLQKHKSLVNNILTKRYGVELIGDINSS